MSVITRSEDNQTVDILSLLLTDAGDMYVLRKDATLTIVGRKHRRAAAIGVSRLPPGEEKKFQTEWAKGCMSFSLILRKIIFFCQNGKPWCYRKQRMIHPAASVL